MICGVGSSSLRGAHLSFWKRKAAQWRQVQQFPCGCVCVFVRPHMGRESPTWRGCACGLVVWEQTSHSQETCGCVWVCVLTCAASEAVCVYMSVCVCTGVHPLDCPARASGHTVWSPSWEAFGEGFRSGQNGSAPMPGPGLRRSGCLCVRKHTHTCMSAAPRFVIPRAGKKPGADQQQNGPANRAVFIPWNTMRQRGRSPAAP